MIPGSPSSSPPRLFLRFPSTAWNFVVQNSLAAHQSQARFAEVPFDTDKLLADRKFNYANDDDIRVALKVNRCLAKC
jgi:hypothetical protein